MKVSFRDAAAEKQSKAPWPSHTYAVALRCICHNLQKTYQHRETIQMEMNIAAVPLVTVTCQLGFSSVRFHRLLLGSTLRTGLPVCVAQQA